MRLSQLATAAVLGGSIAGGMASDANAGANDQKKFKTTGIIDIHNTSNQPADVWIAVNTTTPKQWHRLGTVKPGKNHKFKVIKGPLPYIIDGTVVGGNPYNPEFGSKSFYLDNKFTWQIN